MLRKKKMPKKTVQENPCHVWDFTMPAEGINFDELVAFLKRKAKAWVFQLEQGEKTGYLHYQGRISLKTKSRKGPVFEGGHIHWSVTTNENKENDFYVTKPETRVKGPWSDKDAYIPKQVREITLKPWQQYVLDDADRWDTRTINIIIDMKGGIGKSTIAIYAGSRGLGRMIPSMDSYKDYMRMVCDAPKSRLYLIDLPRSINKIGCGSFWSAIESIKNGYVYDDRYNFRECYFDSPNIWVFANTIPEQDFLSRDRWKYWQVVDDELVPYIMGDAGAYCNTNYVGTGTSGTNLIDLLP